MSGSKHSLENKLWCGTAAINWMPADTRQEAIVIYGATEYNWKFYFPKTVMIAW